jgi:hypothetical protein
MSMRFDSEWGVVQRLKVEADTFTALLGAFEVACVEHKEATHFAVHSEPDGSTFLCLLWTDADMGKPLPFHLDGAEEMAAFTRKWLEKEAKYPTERPDTDGSVNQGFRVEAISGYEVARITPTWIIYGK